MVVCIKFQNDIEEFSMLFGDSYKKWYEQLSEYMFRTKLKPCKPYYILASKKKWISYGGLKWCCLDDFQEELDKENNNRKVNDLHFKDASNYIINKVKSIEDYVFGGKQ